MINNRKQSVKHLSDVEDEEKIEFLNSIDTILTDCDGVIWVPSKAITSGGELVRSWRGLGKNIYFVSNNSFITMETYKDKFASYNIPIRKEDLIHPALSIVEYLKKINFTKKCFVIATPAFKGVLTDSGIKIYDGSDDHIDGSIDYLTSDSHKEDLDKDIGAVVLDIDFNTTYKNLTKCYELLLRPDMLFLVGATEKNVYLTPSLSFIGPGYFMDILIGMTGKQPIIMGKPGKDLACHLNYKCKIQDPDRVLFIGDLLQSDIGFGTLGGFKKLLVLSGGTTLEDLNNCDNDDYIPDYYVDSIADLLPIIYSIKRKEVSS